MERQWKTIQWVGQGKAVKEEWKDSGKAVGRSWTGSENILKDTNSLRESKSAHHPGQVRLHDGRLEGEGGQLLRSDLGGELLPLLRGVPGPRWEDILPFGYATISNHWSAAEGAPQSIMQKVMQERRTTSRRADEQTSG